MTVYVDAIFDQVGPRGHHKWCHMMGDADDAELHHIAKLIGLKRAWFQGDHYDLTPSKREMAIRLGALECDTRMLVELRRARRAKEVVR